MNTTKEKTPTDIEVKSESLSKSTNQIIKQEESIVNDYDIDTYLEKRAEFITKVNKIMVDGKDYHVIQNKKSLAKGGAEKIASIFGWQAAFIRDEDVIGSFKLEGLIAFKCTLTKSSTFVGEGRGSALLAKNGTDPNKTIKMAQKSAFIDAVLRSSGLSDFFTQDLEDMPKEQISQPREVQAKNIPYFCSVHDDTIMLRPAGKTKQGKLYNAFYACSLKDENGKFCKAPILNSDGVRVRQNPETGEMIADNEPESSVDKARRILNAKVPKAPYSFPEGD